MHVHIISKDFIDDKWQVNTDWLEVSNGSVPSGSKPLPEPMLIKTYDATW